MAQPDSPAAEPTPSVNIIRKNSTENNCGKNRTRLTHNVNTTSPCHSQQIHGVSYLRTPGEFRDGVWVGDKSQAVAAAHHVVDVSVQLVGEVAENGENSEAREEGSEGVRQADDPRVPGGKSK